MATRIGLAQQDGGANVDAETICYGAAISACEKTRWQLALGWLSRMAEAKGEADTIGYQCGDGVSHTVPIYERTEAHRRISLEQSWSRLRAQRKWKEPSGGEYHQSQCGNKCVLEGTRVATRMGLAQHDGSSNTHWTSRDLSRRIKLWCHLTASSFLLWFQSSPWM